MYQFIRWLLFFPAKIIDYLAILLQLLYLPYFLLFVKGKHGYLIHLNQVDINQKIVDIETKAKLSAPDEYGFQRPESHALLQQAGSGLLNPHLQDKLLEQTVNIDGSIRRRFPMEESHIGNSGDCLSSWVFCYVLWGSKRKDLLRRVATHYLKNCFGMIWQSKNKVSVRSSNGGISAVADGWKGLSQPITGPAFFTTQALLGVAKRDLGGIWYTVYYIHWMLCGGWFYSLWPVFYFKNDLLYYVHIITAMNLWTLNKTTGRYRIALKRLQKIAPAGNTHPFLCGLINDCGLLSEDVRYRAVLTLCNIKGAHYWPQHNPSSQKFLKGDIENNYTMAYLYAKLLEKKP